MPAKRLLIKLSTLGLLALFLVGCGAGQQPTQAPTPADAQPTQASAAPTELKIAIPNQTTMEQPWNSSLVQAVERVAATKPHGLTITYKFFENVAEPDAERVLREFASTGEYGIVISHGVYPDAVGVLKDEFPEILWMGTGAGWEALGGNMYWVDISLYEPAYLTGILAGMMTQTDVIGAVAAFPYPNVNSPVNAYFDGARSVNPEVQTRMAYIESWFDPPKAKESAAAQINAGADVIFAERYGPFEACAEKSVYCVGYFTDQNELSPDTVLTSPLVLWDPYVKYAIDRWWEHTVDGVPYNAPTEKIVFDMAQGGSDLAPYYKLADVIPPETQAKVAEVKQEILDGTFQVPYNEAPVETQ